MAVDAHCHLCDMKGFDLGKIDLAVNCAYDSGSARRVIAFAVAHPGKTVPVVGLSPQRCMHAGAEDEISDIFRMAGESKESILGVGEIGLDYNWADTPGKRRMQMKCFEMQVRIADELDLPVVVHSRNAVRDCIGGLSRLGNGVMFHFFSGSAVEAEEIVDRGWLISIPPLKSGGRLKAIGKVGLECLAAETDAPYVGRTPLDVVKSIQVIADVKGIGFHDAEEATGKSVKRLFGV